MTNMNGTGPGIELRGLEKSFKTPHGIVEAVRGVDISIRAGEIVALLGPNGAGKSTTIDMLLGLAQPDAGSVSLFGRTPEEAVLAGRVGAMLQTGMLIGDLAARELVAMVASLYPAPLDVDEVISLVGIEAIAERRTQKLSGGEAQRVRFALALVSDPALLVLDEPTTAMDVESRHAFWRTMRAFAARGRTILFATHYLDEADDAAERIVVLSHGRVVADGSARSIKSQVSDRVVSFTFPAAPPAAIAAIEAMPGVSGVEVDGDRLAVATTDSDAVIQRLFAGGLGIHDLEIRGAGLEDAFIALTSADDPAA